MLFHELPQKHQVGLRYLFKFDRGGRLVLHQLVDFVVDRMNIAPGLLFVQNVQGIELNLVLVAALNFLTKEQTLIPEAEILRFPVVRADRSLHLLCT